MAGQTVAMKQVVSNARREYLADGTIEVLGASSNVLATFGFTATAGSSIGGIWTMGFDNATVAASASGAAASAQAKTSGGVVALIFSVSEVGGDGEMQLSTLEITSGQAVTILAATVTE